MEEYRVLSAAGDRLHVAEIARASARQGYLEEVVHDHLRGRCVIMHLWDLERLLGQRTGSQLLGMIVE